MSASVFDAHACSLGEGPLWHPERQQLFWFDINAHALRTRTESVAQAWTFDRPVSAAGWIDHDTLLIATSSDLIRFDIASGAIEHVVPLEANNPLTRSNDGRADPKGGFWIGTMGLNAEAGAGALYRYYRGSVRCLRDKITIPNATAFAPDGRSATFADTPERIVWRIALDPDGWPEGDWQVYLDHRAEGIAPDGAVFDSSGNFWCAEWGASRVCCYDPNSNRINEISFAALQPTCPSFGGADLSTLFITTATERMDSLALAQAPLSGKTLMTLPGVRGQSEHRVIL